MKREETKEAIKVMQHYADGGDVEYTSGAGWHPVTRTEGPSWNWKACQYRIKQEPRELWVVVCPGYAPNACESEEMASEFAKHIEGAEAVRFREVTEDNDNG